jgi:electron transport complex protein RnfE
MLTVPSARFLDGFWTNNTALVQLLGLCPLLAITTTAVNGLALGIASTAVVTTTNVIVSSLRSQLVSSVRIPVFVLVIAALVTSIDLLTNAFFFGLHQRLGLFIPLIITNCAILAQAETIASRHGPVPSTLSGLATGAGFAAVLTVLGALRELLGQGSLFAGLPLLAGEWSGVLAVKLPFDGMLAFVLPPGAFFGLALLIALRNYWHQRHPAERVSAAAEAEPRESG